MEGVGIRAISRLTGLHQQTVLNVLEASGKHCARLPNEKVQGVKCEQVEVDELYSYVGKRPQNVEANHPTLGEFYCYLAMDRDTKLVLGHLVDKRNRENAGLFLQDLKGRVGGRFQLSTDGYLSYTGHRGAVFQTFRQSIDYGVEIKAFGPAMEGQRRFNPPVVKWVKRIPQIGNPDLDKVNTSRCERLNLTVRLFNKRFARCTMGYSKKLENHRHATAILLAHYN